MEHWTCFSSEKFRQAVRAGLRPRGLAASFNAAFGPDVTKEWIQFVMTDNSEWGLCESCAAALEGFIGHVLKFQGKTADEAMTAAQAAAVPNAKTQSIKVTHDVVANAAEGMGADADGAIEAAKRKVPAEAFDVGAAEIVRSGGQGEIRVEAESATKAFAEAPEGAGFVGTTCLVEPKPGFLGIGKKPGVFSFAWTRPFRARIPYKLPAEVTLTYTEK
jgi:hypothetical protein